jgi:hypothetical protein
LDNFIATSFTKWKWLSDKDLKADLKEWADKMKQKDMRCLIKGMKEERAHFTSQQFTNEFMCTRPTIMVKGLSYAKESNIFLCSPCLPQNQQDKSCEVGGW